MRIASLVAAVFLIEPEIYPYSESEDGVRLVFTPDRLVTGKAMLIPAGRVTEAEAESQDGALGPDSCKPSTTDNPAPAAADIERSFFFSQCLLSQGVAYTVVLYVQDAATGSAVVSFLNFTVPSDPKVDLCPS